MENTEAQTTVMNVSALPSFNYPLYMDPEGNQSQPLYSVHTLQKRQIQSDVQQERQDYLLFANRRFLVQVGRSGDGVQAYRLGDSNNAIAVDFDLREKYMFWSDVALKRISRAFLNGSQLTVLVDSGINVTGKQLIGIQ